MEDSPTIEQSFSVPFSYPVVFARDVFGEDSEVVDEACRRDILLRPSAKSTRQDVASTKKPQISDVVCFVDSGLAMARPGLIPAIQTWFAARTERFRLVLPPVEVMGGEAVKNDYRLTMQMVDTMLEHRLCRHSLVFAAGGGAVLDAVGFAASIVHRGLRVVRFPSTTLAQCDAGLGVKNGMNLHGGKNIVGTFHPPHAVINDLSWLDRLPQEHWIGGVAEAFKVALIKDVVFFDELCSLAPRLATRDVPAMERVVRRCADLHLHHIRSSGDPFELGTARPLDFAHWSAHKLECMSNYRISHGQAVAIGIALDMVYAGKQGWVSAAACEKALQGLANCGFRLWQPELDRRLGDGRHEILQGVEEFREHLGGELCLTYPHGVGEKRETDRVDESMMAAAIADLTERYSKQPSL